METKRKYGLYVHIPFCVSKCAYCDFASVAKNSKLINLYTNALCAEMAMHKAKFTDVVFDTVFIGGGTPSCIPQDNLVKIINSIYRNFNIQTVEFTVEINPGTGDISLFKTLNDLGVNRASIGLQCANDSILKSIGRIHTIEQFVDTVNEVKNAKITNFSVDIISGLPNQTKNDLIASVDLASKLGANHISMYTLKLEENTPLEIAAHNGSVTLPSQEDEYQMSLGARQHLESLGFNRYEISNYAKNGCESKHNLKYWNRTPYVGVGVAAASMLGDTRYVNTNSIQDYIEAVNADKLPISETNELTKDDIAFEMIMLSTRLSSGMRYSDYDKLTGEEFTEKYALILDELSKENLIKKSNTHFILTPKGMDIQNQVLLKFMD